MVMWTLKAAIRVNNACKHLIAKHVNFFQYKTMIFLDSGSVTFFCWLKPGGPNTRYVLFIELYSIWNRWKDVCRTPWTWQQWLVHRPLLEVPSSVPWQVRKNCVVQTCFPLCYLQGWHLLQDKFATLRIETLTGGPAPVAGRVRHPLCRLKNPTVYITTWRLSSCKTGVYNVHLLINIMQYHEYG